MTYNLVKVSRNEPHPGVLRRRTTASQGPSEAPEDVDLVDVHEDAERPSEDRTEAPGADERWLAGVFEADTL